MRSELSNTVEKPEDREPGMLIIRARVAGELAARGKAAVALILVRVGHKVSISLAPSQRAPS